MGDKYIGQLPAFPSDPAADPLPGTCMHPGRRSPHQRGDDLWLTGHCCPLAMHTCRSWLPESQGKSARKISSSREVPPVSRRAATSFFSPSRPPPGAPLSPCLYFMPTQNRDKAGCAARPTTSQPACSARLLGAAPMPCNRLPPPLLAAQPPAQGMHFPPPAFSKNTNEAGPLLRSYYTKLCYLQPRPQIPLDVS